MPLLSIDELSIRFGGIVALDGVSFEIERGHIAGLIGPNGAGKTTVFNCISRYYRPDTGVITFDGQDVLRLRTDRLVEVGIARTFQQAEVFKTMSVLNNLLVGPARAERNGGGVLGWASGAWRSRAAQRRRRLARDRAAIRSAATRCRRPAAPQVSSDSSVSRLGPYRRVVLRACRRCVRCRTRRSAGSADGPIGTGA